MVLCFGLIDVVSMEKFTFRLEWFVFGGFGLLRRLHKPYRSAFQHNINKPGAELKK